VKIAYGELRMRTQRALREAGLSEDDSASTARSIVLAQAWGIDSHGLSRLPVYLDRIRRGGYPAQAHLVVTADYGALAVLDGQGGIGHWQLSRAVEMAVPRARQFGVAAVAVGNSGHCGALGVYAADAAEAGMACLVFSSGPAVMPPAGGHAPVMSTSPIAAGFPVRGRPLVVDLALSTVARGTVAARARRGEPLAEGWGFDRSGEPTTDAAAALAGMLAPLGGAKGFALSVMVEALTGALVGPSLSVGIPDFFDADRAADPQRIAHLVLMLDPEKTDAGGDPAAAARRIALLVREIERAGGRAPGSRRIAPTAVPDDHPVEVDDEFVPPALP
jgi:(2R)-3-sulfolactate dehydrogenase (NADP+)